MKQKFLLLTISLLLLSSVWFHESIACGDKSKKATTATQLAVAKKKMAKSDVMLFDLFPFTQSILLN